MFISYRFHPSTWLATVQTGIAIHTGEENNSNTCSGAGQQEKNTFETRLWSQKLCIKDFCTIIWERIHLALDFSLNSFNISVISQGFFPAMLVCFSVCSIQHPKRMFWRTFCNLGPKRGTDFAVLGLKLEVAMHCGVNRVWSLGSNNSVFTSVYFQYIAFYGEFHLQKTAKKIKVTSNLLLYTVKRYYPL